MKKSLIAVLAIPLLAIFVFAQTPFYDFFNDDYSVRQGRWDSVGLGIGNIAPTEKLDVTGNIAVSGTVDGVDIAARDHAATINTDAESKCTGANILEGSGACVANAGGVALSDNNVWTGTNDFTKTIKYSTSTAFAGAFLKFDTDGETLVPVSGGELPIDPKLIGFNIKQNSANPSERFISNPSRFYLLGMPPTQYLEGNSQDTNTAVENDSGIVVFATGTLKNLACYSETNQGEFCDFTVRVNKADTSLVCKFSSASNTPETCSDSVNEVSVSPGDIITIQNGAAGCLIAANGACYFLLAF